MKYLCTLKMKVKNTIWKFHPLRILYIFYTSVWRGFKEYKNIKKIYGTDIQIISATSKGTGDQYLMGLYFREWLNENNIMKYVVLVGGEV